MKNLKIQKTESKYGLQDYVEFTLQSSYGSYFGRIVSIVYRSNYGVDIKDENFFQYRILYGENKSEWIIEENIIGKLK